LPCGWSKDGLETFNKLAKEIHNNRKDHGEEFDKAFKDKIEQEMASINKTGKRKRNCINTYNDLNEGGLIINKQEDNSEEEEEEEWVTTNVFVV
jgi:hypothetical protein